MEIRGEKELQYINKLYFEFEEDGVLRKAVNKIRRKDQRYTKSEIAEFLNHEHDSYAHEFLDKLIEHGILKHAGKRKTASNQVDTWKLDKGKLLDEYIESRRFQEHKELNAAALDHSGEAWKIN
jgi:hypothetical protein